MSITSLESRNEYTASASQQIFNYTFRIYTSADLNVYVTAAGAECSDSDLTTDYVVDPGTIDDPAGGFITFNSGLTAGDKVTINSAIVEDRTVDYQNNGDFKPATVNADFDRTLSIVKQIQTQVDRTPKYLECQQQSNNLILPQPEALKLLRYNGDADGFDNVTTSELDPDLIVSQDISISRETVAAMLADPDATAGQVYGVENYATGNSSGRLFFKATSGPAPSPDGGSQIDHDFLSLHFVQNFPKGRIFADMFGAAPNITATLNTPRIEAAMSYVGSLGGGVVHLGAGQYNFSSLTWPAACVILEGVNGFGNPEIITTTALGTKLNYNGVAGIAMRCHFSDCGIRNLMVIDSATNATTGLDLSPGASPGTGEVSSYFRIHNSVVRGFLVQVDAPAMSGNDGGWFHQYSNFVFAGRGKAAAGSRGVNITSNSASMVHGQVRGCEIGIDQGADKNVFDCEISGCGIGWQPNGGAFSHHIFTTEANDQDLDFNDSAINRDNHVHLMFSDSGTLDSASVPASNQNTMQFGNTFHGIRHRTVTQTQRGTVLLTFNGGVATLFQNQTSGMVTGVTRLQAGEYQLNLRKSVNYISAQAIIMQTNNLRAVIASSLPLRGSGSDNKIIIRTYGYNNTTLTELPAAADQGVLIELSNFQTDIIDI